MEHHQGGQQDLLGAVRLIGVMVDVRLYTDHVEVYYKGHLVESMERIRGRGKARIDYRHIIGSLVRKPGAFARYRFREQMYPTHTFRLAYDAMRGWKGERADVDYVRILHLAATTAVNAWNASSAGVNFCQGSGCGEDYSDSRDGKVTIKVSSSGGCGNGIACVSPGFWYPHKIETTLTIEQPASTSNGRIITWTNMIEETTFSMFYLPGVVMHEFGHTTGIGHNSNRQVGGVMVHKAVIVDALADYDVQVMRVSIAGIESHD